MVKKLQPFKREEAIEGIVALRSTDRTVLYQTTEEPLERVMGLISSPSWCLSSKILCLWDHQSQALKNFSANDCYFPLLLGQQMTGVSLVL